MRRITDARQKVLIAQQANAAIVARNELLANQQQDIIARCDYDKEMYALSVLCTCFGLSAPKIWHFLEKHSYKELAEMSVDEFSERFKFVIWE